MECFCILLTIRPGGRFERMTHKTKGHPSLWRSRLVQERDAFIIQNTVNTRAPPSFPDKKHVSLHVVTGWLHTSVFAANRPMWQFWQDLHAFSLYKNAELLQIKPKGKEGNYSEAHGPKDVWEARARAPSKKKDISFDCLHMGEFGRMLSPCLQQRELAPGYRFGWGSVWVAIPPNLEV